MEATAAEVDSDGEGAASARPKRADALRNIETIVDAATRLLAVDPDTTVNEIAKEAGVGRITLYGHFESRAALIHEVADRAIAHTDEALADVDIDGDPRAALGRLIEASWHLNHRYGALVVAAAQSLSPEAQRRAHDEPAARVRSLLQRGRDSGSFRGDAPLEWQIIVIQAILHGASTAVYQGEITAEDAPGLVRDAVLSAVSAS